MFDKGQYSYPKQTQTLTKDSGLCLSRLCSTEHCIYIFSVKSEVSDMHVDTIMESHDVAFFANIFPMKDIHNITRFFF